MSSGGAGGGDHRGGGRGRAGSRKRRESSAGGVVFRLESGRPRFLLIQDSHGNWGFPKGHLERGERADTAALREVMEETGLRQVTVLGAIDTIDWHFRLHGALIHKHCQFFLMESAGGEPTPQQSEGITACRWATVEEALKLIRYENARGILRRAHELLPHTARPADVAAHRLA